MADWEFIDGVYYGKSTASKPTNLNQIAFWFNIDNADEHKLYAFDPETKQWIAQD